MPQAVASLSVFYMSEIAMPVSDAQIAAGITALQAAITNLQTKSANIDLANAAHQAAIDANNAGKDAINFQVRKLSARLDQVNTYAGNPPPADPAVGPIQ